MQKARSIKILLVEDLEMNRRLILQSLQNWLDIIMDGAANGKEAVEKIQQNEYDIVLMDLRMPVMNGYEAASIIRSLPEEKHKQVPIIALTGDNAEHFYKNTEATFFTDILTKPFDINDLKLKILQYVPTPDHQQIAGSKSAKAESLFKGNKQREEIFYRQVRETLQSFKSNFAAAMHQQDAEKLSDLKHKALLVMDVLALDNLRAALEISQKLLKKNASSSQIEQVIAEGEACFDAALEIVQERMEHS